MTPGARISAAIEVLDAVLKGAAAEKALTSWARRSRFAGAKDRAAIRDHVFDALRNLASYQSIAGQVPQESSGRDVFIGSLRAKQANLSEIFSGIGHAPAELTAEEAARAPLQSTEPDMPATAFSLLTSAFGTEIAWDQARVLRTRAPVSLRVNTRKASRDAVRSMLEEAGFSPLLNEVSPTALSFYQAPRGLVASEAFKQGFFELQDAASQAVVDSLQLPETGDILDFCAGGGGKTLALAARTGQRITAYDATPGRMEDLATRAERADALVHRVNDARQLEANQFGFVLCDVPCSGSGSWRRAPDAKWKFDLEAFDKIVKTQKEILTKAQPLVANTGVLAYATCSIFREENEAQRDWFLQSYPQWKVVREQRWWANADGDGFFLAQFTRR